jgi:hypothetical protein
MKIHVSRHISAGVVEVKVAGIPLIADVFCYTAKNRGGNGHDAVEIRAVFTPRIGVRTVRNVILDHNECLRKGVQ